MSLEDAKRASVGQLLFRCARQLNERAIARVRQATGKPVRTAHTLLFPHIDLTGTRQTELARRLGVSKQAVGVLVDELVAMGALERLPDPADGRARLVRFADGPDTLLHGLQVLAGLERELAEELGPSRWAALHEALLALDRTLGDQGGPPGDAGVGT